jgi:hypothetical protein
MYRRPMKSGRTTCRSEACTPTDDNRQRDNLAGRISPGSKKQSSGMESSSAPVSHTGGENQKVGSKKPPPSGEAEASCSSHPSRSSSREGVLVKAI